VNNFWVKDVAMSAPGVAFFSTFVSERARHWTELRNVWEISHVIRACLDMLSLISIAVATSLYTSAP
jgi:hypothetical protein